MNPGESKNKTDQFAPLYYGLAYFSVFRLENFTFDILQHKFNTHLVLKSICNLSTGTSVRL